MSGRVGETESYCVRVCWADEWAPEGVYIEPSPGLIPGHGGKGTFYLSSRLTPVRSARAKGTRDIVAVSPTVRDGSHQEGEAALFDRAARDRT